MELRRTTDNNCGTFKFDEKNEKDKNNLSSIANVKLKDLQKEHSNLLIFPANLGDHEDDIGNQLLFSLSGDILTTGNCMGFVSCNDTQLTISSRFYPNGNDYFLHYMLQKVFALNILDMDFSTSKDDVSDIFLLYLFPFYLKKALQQGLFKEYQRQNHNDTNVKGAINIPRHLKQNQPFMGKIAYTTREHTYDNRMTQLIRHTIEYIKTHVLGNSILTANSENTIAAQQIFYATPSYQKNARINVIQQNQKTVHHPYFTEYETLRKICLQILNKEGISFGKEKDKVYGLVFDGAWLWEEYLNTVLKDEGFTHAENKAGKYGIDIFQSKKSKWYPDFYSEKMEIVLDAKYKNLKKGVGSNDLHQIISYMYILKSKIGIFIYPFSDDEPINDDENEIKEFGNLKGYCGEVKTYGVKIPQNESNFQDFIDKMRENEKALQTQIKI
jgi:5-methylcytosine-specific restriction enzyme subunit McrC